MLRRMLQLISEALTSINSGKVLEKAVPVTELSISEVVRRLFSTLLVFFSLVSEECTVTMSLCIDIEKFPNMTAVLKEVERQRNLRIFSAIAPDQTNIHKPLTRTMSTSRPEALNKHQNAKRQASDPSNSRRNRLSSTPCSTIDHWKPKFDGRLTAAAKKLSEEELRLLEEDILKPVDVFFVLRQIREETVSSDQLFQ